MERVEAIRRHPRFQEEYGRLAAAERDRPFCRHDMDHLLAVARLMYIYALEEKADIPKELLYAAALLHDVGRYAQLDRGTPHHLAGARIGGEILKDCGFSAEEIQRIQGAILAHRGGTGEEPLAAYLYRGDKQSRACFACPAAAECNWPPEKRNRQITD